MFLYGPNTSGKSHVLKPLMEIYAECCFLRPAGKGNYPLEGLFGAKVCVLQDVRTSTFKLAWDDLLVWFEGEKFNVPLPRNRHSQGMLYSERAPVFISTGSKFCISEQEAACLKVDAQEQNKMMDARFRFFHFPRSLTAAEKRKTPACKRCFAAWLLSEDPGSAAAAPRQQAAAAMSPAMQAAEAITDWIETHGGSLYLSGPSCNLAALSDALQWAVNYLPTCGRLLPFLRQHGSVAEGNMDVIMSMRAP